MTSRSLAWPTQGNRSSVQEEERFPVLDGIRGLAVLAVLIYHFVPKIHMESWAARCVGRVIGGGWAGVNLFFVLSGFLITGILLKTKDREGYYKSFFIRRALRIFPLYYAALAVVFVVIPALGLWRGEAFYALADSQAYHWFYLTDFGYGLFGADAFVADYVDLGHFWSLAVEEHFYLLWPFIVARFDARSLRWVCLGLFASSFLVRAGLVFSVGPASGWFYFTPCHWDAIAAGGFVALLTREPGRLWHRPIAKVCLVAALGVTLLLSVRMKGLWPTSAATRLVGQSTLAILFAAAIFLAVTVSSSSRWRLALSSKFLGFFGKYSYGLYVIHGLLFGVFHGILPIEPWVTALRSPFLASIALILVQLGITLVLAMLSWRCLEAPFLKLKYRFVPGEPELEQPLVELGRKAT